MLFASLALAAAAAVSVSAQNQSLCDKYTTALLKNNTAENQLTLLTLVVNTAVIGNYTQPNVGIKVPGLLSPTTINGTKVDLLQYFNGSLASSNREGKAVAVNFLDDGGAVPLTLNKPANGTSSNQYTLLTHLYSYFGTALGCSTVGNNSFPAYAGQASQYTVHKYMALNHAEVTWFIMNVGLSAASFGVASADVTTVGNLLNSVFNYKQAAAATVIPAQGPQLQSICIENDCPTAPKANASAYASVVEPSKATGSLAPSSTPAGGSGSGSSTSGSPASSGSPAPSGAATHLGVSSGLAGLAALFALVL